MKDPVYIAEIKTCYKRQYKLENIEVVGLLIGARGTITHNFVQFSKTFNLEPKLLNTVSVTVLKYPIQILRNHIYTK